MTYPDLRFASITAARPTRESLAAGQGEVLALLAANNQAGAIAAFDAWRRAYDSWAALTQLHFQQDTQNEAARAERDHMDALTPESTRLEVEVKRRLLEQPDLATLIGQHAEALWRTDITTFEPAIQPALEEEARTEGRYTELLAAARIHFDGEARNLAAMEPYAEDADRATRKAACEAQWAWFADHAEPLDAIFDELVQLRHGMATTLGYENYLGLGYRRLRRTDYGPADVAAYREQIVRHVVPLVGRILQQRRKDFGWDRLRFWDEPLIDPAGNPRPAGGHDFLVEAAQSMFDALDPRLGTFYAAMRTGDFMDLRNRPTKAGGGFCTSFPTVGMPFIFANFNGTHNDIGVFTHEMGHAFQNAQSRTQPLIDYLWPTYEAAEINSMGLEFLTHPVIGHLVGDDAAERFRRLHLVSALAFLPYGVCIDHFQHEVYQNPSATPAERHAMWQRLESLYLPWADYGDIGFLNQGGRWQAKRHVYLSPLYYIDYTLAQCCALQFWVQARHDPADAMNRYVALCARGGSAPFQQLAREAGLASPFAPDALAAVVAEAARELGL